MNTVPYRKELSDWKFALDQNESGESFGWTARTFDDSGWKDVKNYTSWETYEDAMADYEGVAWFRTTFRVMDKCPQPRKFVLHFEGIGGTAEVYFNGRFMGSNENRYLPFDIDITRPIISYGDNVVAVRVDNSNRGRKHLTGADRVEWVLYGGLTHKIYLEEQPSYCIKNVRIDARADGTADVTLKIINRIESDYHGYAGFYIQELPQCKAEREIDCTGEKSITVKFHTKAEDVKLWSPETPNLYHLVAYMKDDDGDLRHQITERFGFRTICVEGTKILLNGEEILLKGVNRYDDYAPYGICPPEDKIREDLQAIKAMGCNLIRTHYPQDRIHYEIADEIGLMYMIEVPLNWWKPERNETLMDFYGLAAEAVDALDRTFENFCNHPCWTIWSTSNECSFSHPACEELFRKLVGRMKAMDCGRLCTTVASQPITNGTDLDYCDIICYNRYPGCSPRCNSSADFTLQLDHYMDDELEKLLEFYPDKPHVQTEFGCVCVAGLHGDPNAGRFTEEFAATVIEKQCEGFLTDPNMKGLVIWSWADYRHRRGFIPSAFDMGMAATYGPYGLVAMDRTPKQPVIDTMKKVFDDFQVK